jgi:hypothetical protein
MTSRYLGKELRLTGRNATQLTLYFLIGKELRLTGRDAKQLTFHFLIRSYKYILQPRGGIIISLPETLKNLDTYQNRWTVNTEIFELF